MIYVTYKDLVVRYGVKAADNTTRTIEKLAHLQNEIATPLDPELRWQRALEALNAINFAVNGH